MIIKNEQESIQAYMEDASGLLGGHAERLVIPENADDVARILAEATAKGTTVTVSGGGTGVTGGRIPFGGSLLSLERLNAIHEIREIGGGRAVARVGAGVVVRDLKAAARERGWLYAPDPTEQSSFIGGNLSTNASGSRGFKYGSTRHYVRKLTVVLATGEIVRLERGRTFAKDGELVIPHDKGELKLRLPKYSLPEIKNAAGYFNRPGMDAIDLFIGHEGTLGVITEAEVLLVPKIERVLSGIAFFPSSEASWRFVSETRAVSHANRAAGNDHALNAMTIEYFDRHALELLMGDYPNIPAKAQAAIFFEQDVNDATEDDVLAAWAGMLELHGIPSDGVWLGTGEKEEKFFREFRHRLPERVNEIVRRNGFPKTGTDICVPLEHFDTMMHFYDEKLNSSGMEHLMFGHIGESHMHANLLPKDEKEYALSKQTYLLLVEKALSLGGTVSAEHGIGKLKHAFIQRMLGEGGMREMARLKRTLDPACILGPGNLIPAPLLKEL